MKVVDLIVMFGSALLFGAALFQDDLVLAGVAALAGVNAARLLDRKEESP